MCYYSLVRAEVKENYNYRCQLCYEQLPSQKLQIHHIRRRHDGGCNSHFNLLPLCGLCHMAVHSNNITHNSKNQRIMYLSHELLLEA
jgi:predicted restriction endonuclease